MTSSIDSPLLAPSISENPNMTQFPESSDLHVFITPPESDRQLPRNNAVPTGGAKKDDDTKRKRKLELDLSLDSPSEPLQMLEKREHLPLVPGTKRVKRKNPKGETPLHVACRNNKITRVRELLNEPDIDVNARDNAEWTPLHEACNHGHAACVKELLKFAPGKGKIKNSGERSRSMQTLDLLAAPSECWTTPLHDAVFNKQIEVVKLLVEAGGDSEMSLLTVENKAGYTPVGMALTEVMKEALLGQRLEVSRSPAVEEENQNISRSSIAHHSPKPLTRKTKVNRRDGKGETALHVACRNNNITRVRELLNEPDIDINARDNAEWTPLHEACNHGHTACVKELLKFTPGKGKITNSGKRSRCMQTLDLLAAPSKCGTTPLHDAVFNKQIEVVKLLVEAGEMSLLTVENKAGYTPVGMALTEDMKEALLGQRLEVSRSPAIEEENQNNASTSKEANVRRSPRHLKGGSRLQSNTNVKDRSRETLPSSKPNSAKDEVSRSSIAHHSPKPLTRKTKVNYKNGKGETGLHVACRNNNISRVRELLNEPDIDVNARDNAEWTPLHEACNHGHTACVKELLKFAPGKGKITSKRNRSMQTLDLLAAPSKCGTTPLHDAVFNKQIEVVKLLVKAGEMSLLTVENKAGYTPVRMALTEDMKEALGGQRLEVSRSPAVEEENQNNASTSKEANVRRSPRRLKGGSRLQNNTNVKEGSRETLPISKTNSGKDEGSAIPKLPSEKDDASVPPDSPGRIIDKLLLRIARLVPMDKVIDLGTALNIGYAQIERYSAKNHDSGSSKFEGTLKMLQDWNLQHEDNVIPDLVSALKEAKMSKLSKRLKLNTL